MKISEWPRRLDHCVLPTADLGTARERLELLGFTVAPIGVHPFGTANHCVYFPDGSFLESLAVVDRREAEKAVDADNVFVDHDRRYRAVRGEEGFSALVFQTEDALGDHQTFVSAGVSAGPVLDFSRAFVDADGQQGKVSFRLAFAKVSDAPDTLIFTCQRVAVAKVDRAALQRHRNGVTGIRSIGVSRADALAPIRAAMTSTGEGSSLVDVASGPSGAVVHLSTAQSMRGDLTSICFAVESLHGVEALLAGASIGYSTVDGRIVVATAPGQGATFIFEAGT